MSQQAVSIPFVPEKAASRSFVGHAKLIGFLTLISRILGMARESVAANYFGAGAVWSAFTVAFTIPNLFRKLFGEGALSAAFIPLYAQAIRREEQEKSADDRARYSANEFAVASVNLLLLILVGLTILGEIVLFASALIWDMRPDRLLAMKLTAVMLPYVLLVCGAAFLSGILQVHRRFGVPAAVSIILNLCLIVGIVVGASLFDLDTEAGQEKAVYLLALVVLFAGAMQVAMLLPSLHRVGFRFRLLLHFWTPPIRRMLKLTLPVALGAGVLQLSVFLDKGISLLLAAGEGDESFQLLGHTLRYPLEAGAAARLNWAQYLYQFPLGIFAIALATAIFPRLSADAMDADRQRFRDVLRRGIEATLFIGLPASVGLIVVARPAVTLLFQHGNFTPHDTTLVAVSTALYASAVWAFSLQQILNRAYYALHDTITPLLLSIVTLLVNLAVELPLMWSIGEAGLAAGTAISFALQSVVMLAILRRRTGGLGLSRSVANIFRMLCAALVMGGACMAIKITPLYPAGDGKIRAMAQLIILLCVGGSLYFVACAAMGLNVWSEFRRRNDT